MENERGWYYSVPILYMEREQAQRTWANIIQRRARLGVFLLVRLFFPEGKNGASFCGVTQTHKPLEIAAKSGDPPTHAQKNYHPLI